MSFLNSGSLVMLDNIFTNQSQLTILSDFLKKLFNYWILIATCYRTQSKDNQQNFHFYYWLFSNFSLSPRMNGKFLRGTFLYIFLSLFFLREQKKITIFNCLIQWRSQLKSFSESFVTLITWEITSLSTPMVLSIKENHIHDI